MRKPHSARIGDKGGVLARVSVTLSSDFLDEETEEKVKDTIALKLLPVQWGQT